MPTDALMWPNTWIMVYRYSEHKGFSTRRAGHAGCYIAPYFYIFGGFGLNTVFNDLLLYDFAGNNWIFSPSDHQPSPRYFHTVGQTFFNLLLFLLKVFFYFLDELLK